MEKFKVVKIQYVPCKNKLYMRTIRKGIESYEEAKRVSCQNCFEDLRIKNILQ